MARFAEHTRVPTSQSRVEIERVLTRYGAKQFVAGWDSTQRMALVGFAVTVNGTSRQVRMRLPLPDPKKFRSQQHAEQAERSAWRALLLVIKAKLEAVDSGISTIEREFLADIILPNGQTVGEWTGPQIDVAYQTGAMPPLLPAHRSEP